MAQKVQVLLLCDLDDDSVEAQETLHFSLGNSAYEIDVCGRHAQQIREGLEAFIEKGRRTASAGGGRSRRSHPATDREQSVGIRSWAKGRGIHVNDRGRIPASVVKEYEQSH